MAKTTFLKRAPASEEMSLQITSMADIFTIILVFLLKSYATGAENLAPSKGTTLPEAFASQASVEALRVEISEKAVLVEGQPVATLQAFGFDKSDVQQSTGASKALTSALERERKRQLLIAQSNTDVKVDPKIVVISDQRAPYATVKSVLASAALTGYTDFKLAVARGD
jgi:biopolymer transport protein ExbD